MKSYRRSSAFISVPLLVSSSHRRRRRARHFGALLHWNSPYPITGVLSGEPFSAPLEIRGDALDGAVFLQRRPRHIVLTKQIN